MAFSQLLLCFLNQSCLRRANGASRVSAACVSQRHSSAFRLAPHCGHSPRQSLRQMAFMGIGQENLFGQHVGQKTVRRP